MGKFCNEDKKLELLTLLVEAVSDATMGKFGCDFEDQVLLREYFSNVLKREGIFDNCNLIDLDDYINYTLWSRDDIRGELIELGYEDNEENIDKVIDSGLLKHLGNCLDSDWETIHYAIKESLGYMEEREDL